MWGILAGWQGPKCSLPFAMAGQASYCTAMAGQVFRMGAREAKAAIAFIILLGLVLRLVAGAGDVWLDEAWSAAFARKVAPVWGVFLSINHDNNHHLMMLWLQLVGKSAAPLLMRAPAILASTAAIGVAAAIAWRRGHWQAVATALVFAVAPTMVLYGSEARGYALFALAILVAIAIVDRWLETAGAPPPANRLALVAGLGMFSHLMFMPAILCVSAWAWLVRMRSDGARQATRDCLALLAPALIVTAALSAIIIGGAAAVGGMTFGGHKDFSYANMGIAMTELASLGSGFGPYGGRSWTIAAIFGAIVAALALLPPRPAFRDGALALLLVLPLPAVALVLHPANTEYSRYFLIVSLGLFLFVGLRTGAMIERGGILRLAASTLLGAMLLSSLGQFLGLLENGRGRSGEAIALMARERPDGATVQLENERETPVLDVIAAQRGYPLRIVDDRCEPSAAFLIVDRTPGLPFDSSMAKCGSDWTIMTSRFSAGPSGQEWALYRKLGVRQSIKEH